MRLAMAGRTDNRRYQSRKRTPESAIEFLRNQAYAFALQRMLRHSTLQMVQRYLATAETDVESAPQDASLFKNWLVWD
jgi:hypothetical protein